MRDIIVTEFISLDGVIEAPGGEEGYRHTGWTFDIDIRPYSLIAVKGRALPPSAKLFYDLILQRARMLFPDRAQR